MEEITVQGLDRGDAEEVAVMVGEQLAEIMDAIGVQSFSFDLGETIRWLEDFLSRGETLYKGHALYAQGGFGIIAEFHVRPAGGGPARYCYDQRTPCTRRHV